MVLSRLKPTADLTWIAELRLAISPATLDAFAVLRVSPLTRPALETARIVEALESRRVPALDSFVARVPPDPWVPSTSPRAVGMDEPFASPRLDEADLLVVVEPIVAELLRLANQPAGKRALRDQLRQTPWLLLDRRVEQRTRELFALEGGDASSLPGRVAAAPGVGPGRPTSPPHLRALDVETYAALVRRNPRRRIRGRAEAWMNLREVRRKSGRKQQALDRVHSRPMAMLLRPALTWPDDDVRAALRRAAPARRRSALIMPPITESQRRHLMAEIGESDDDGAAPRWGDPDWCSNLADSLSAALQGWFVEHESELAAWGFHAVSPFGVPG